MQKITTILALVLLTAMPMMAERVTPEKARKAATTFLNNNGAKTAQLTDLTKAAGFTNLYIFNAEQGFVVIAADNCVQPILGYSLTGKFVTENMPDNVREWLQGYSDEIQFAIDSKAKPSAKTAKRWKDLIDGNSKAAKATPVVDNMLSTTWDQHPLYNNMCPIYPSTNELTVTGCVATAMAQIMKYWEYPSRGYSSNSYPWQGQTLSANFGNTTYDWANMPSSLSSASTSQEINAVALLMYHCGVSVRMNYDIANNGGSSASEYAAASAYISYFRYNSSPQPQVILKKNYNNTIWLNSLKTELNESRPIQYFGSGTGGGHSFVCCGYDSDDNFYFNWGWSGNNDGFYSLSNLVPGSGGAGGGSYSFTNNQEAIIKIQPMFNNNPPSNLQATVEQGTGYRNISLSWSAATDASQYKIYRNNQNLATVSANDLTYTDVNLPYGTYNYQVRSVDANGLLSQPTNTATVNLEPVVKDLNATPNGNDIALSWTALAANPQSATLQYVECVAPASIGALSSTTQYWAVRYPASTLANYENLALTSVGNWCTYGSNISINVYQCTGSAPTGNAIWTHSFSDNPGNTIGAWREFTFNPILLDPSKDLWIVYASTNAVSGKGPIYMRPVTSSEGNYISYDGVNWNHWNEYTFPIAAGITYGTYTYNLYRNGEKVAQNMSMTNYTDPNRNNAASYYTVTTNYFGGESAASNGVGHTIGQGSLNSLELGANDRMTVNENSTLTVTGTLSNDNPENLILEDGAQLIHSSEGVKATVKKDIAAWTTETPVGGWYFIASPINSTELAPNNVDYMLTDENESGGSRTYDLYRLENGNWKNYRKETFNLTNGKGYLYANESPQTLSFKGEIKPYDAENNTVTISSGWNLIGNPFTCNVVPNMAYHTLNNGASTTSVNADEGLVAPGMGIAVYSENGGTLSFNLPTEGASASSNGNLQMTLTQQVTNRNSTNAITIDNAIVNFDESEGLPKFNLLEANSKLYIPNGDKEYAIVSAEAKGEMPLNFKPCQDGTFTLAIQPESVEMSYLFLIDNLTGCHTNLLTTPNYTFEAKTSDYESRFKLLFATAKEETETSENESFGFITNGQFLSTNGQGLLQVIDLNGRVVRSANEEDCIGLDGLTAGVYVIRFITINGVKTQKIVVE